MGGKHKQAQRIKNNARPSSSGRSAELLASSSQMPQFSTTKEIRFVPPTLSLMKTEEFDSSISPDFQIIFKKMNKKDCTTKLKALQEFADLISNSEAEAIKAILAFWATLYRILATDTDHRIREASHNAHLEIILKDKKIIAPYLKQLIGPWFTSQYDNYPPASSAALKAFAAAFPPNKVQDCVVFCEKEILTYIHENLTSKMDNSKHASNNEDAEAKYERIIISSLQGYCLYLNTLTDEQIRKSTELNQQIISNSRFLKLGSHKTAMIRATWFKVMATLYHKAGFLLNELHGHVVPVVFNNLDESEPAVIGFVWEAALLIMDLGEDWWKYIHIEKNYLSKLRKVLREGGQGNATVIYPNLLSLLHKLPSTVNAEQFYDGFFNNIRMGLKRKSVTASKSESTAIITALVECLQYVILINQQNVELCEKLIDTHLLPLLEWSLKEDQMCYRIVFHQVALLVQYWSRNKDLENYPQYSNLFWTSITNLFKFINLEDSELAERHVTLLQYLKNIAKPREQLKVKFSTNDDEVSTEQETPLQIQIDETYNKNLKDLAYTILKCYVDLIQQKQQKVLLQHLVSVIRLFESKDFLLGLSKYVGGIQSDLLQLYEILLCDWLRSAEFCSEIVVDLAFILLKYLDDKEKSVVLRSFLEFYECESFGWCIKNAFAHPHNEDPLVQNWIHDEKVGRFLVATTETNLKSDCPTNLKSLFKLAFTETNDGELLIGKETVNDIISKLQLPLLNPKNFATSIDSCARLASYISEIIYTETTLLKCGDDLLLALFRFSCTDHSDLENLTSDTQWEINTSWQDALITLSKQLQKEELKKLTVKFANLIEEIFMGNPPVENDTHLIDVLVNFIRAIFNGQPLVITDVFSIFFNRAFLPSWRGKIEELCLDAEYLRGNITNPVGSTKKEIGDVSEENVFKYFVWNFVKISVLSSPLENNDCEDEDEEEEDVKVGSKEIIYAIDDHACLITELLYDLTAGQSFLNNYKMSKYFTNISRYCDLIKEKIKFLLEKLQNHDQIKEKLVTELNAGSWLWCKTIYLLNQEIIHSPPEEVYNAYFKHAASPLSKRHLSQIFGPHLDFDHIQFTGVVLDDVIILRNLLHCDEIDVQIAEVFEKIKKLRSKNIPKFLFDSHDITWQESEEIIQVIRLFSKLISNKFECLNRQHWDFGVISLMSWTTNCLKQRTSYCNKQIQALMVAIAEFYTNLDEKINEIRKNDVKNSFVEEWDDLFLPSIHPELLQLWLYLSGEMVSKTIEYQPFLQEFGKITDHFHHKLIFTKYNNLPNWSKILKLCSTLIINSTPTLQLWGYKMLLILVPGLIEIDLQSNDSNTPNTKGLTFEQFKEVLLHTQNIVNDLLIRFKLGEDSCQVTPFTDSYTYVFGYLLLWCVLLNLCEKSSPELRYQYADSLRNENFLKSLLNNLFKLMPTEILHYNEGKAKSFLKLFLREPNFHFKEPCTSEQLEHIACWVYAFSLAQLPALVRQWWSETEAKMTQIVEKVTAFYVSAQLCNQELLDVTHHETKFKNMTIKIVQSVREVIAIYTVDEAQMELVITLPQNYPLGGPDVRCSRQIGGPLHKQWLMQLKKCLLHQNGRIWDGLSLWNSNLDKKFDGVEECYICFAVLHPGTYQLPKLSCQTCKKKFHSACLYKWFSTSNKSSCPICRNLF